MSAPPWEHGQEARHVLVVPLYLYTPHWETELEIATRHQAQGDRVSFLQCSGTLETCFANPHHWIGRCLDCRARFARGIACLDPMPAVSVISRNHLPEGASISETVQTMSALKGFREDGIRFGLGIASSLLTNEGRSSAIDLDRSGASIDREYRSSRAVLSAFRELCERDRPDLVYVFNGRFSSTYPILEECRRRGIPVFTHDRGGNKDRFLVVRDGLVHDKRAIRSEIETVVSGASPEDRAEGAARYFTDLREGADVGWWSFTKAQSKGLLPDRIHPDRKLITIFNSSIDEFESLEGWESPWRVYSSESDAIDRIASAFEGSETHQIAVRIHPNLSHCDNEQTRSLEGLAIKHPHLIFIRPEEPIHSYSMLDRSAWVVTFGSTIGIEATYWGKPHLLLGKVVYDELNLAHLPETHEEVIDLLRSDAAPASKTDAETYGFWVSRRGHQWLDYRPESLVAGTFKGVRIGARVSEIFARILTSAEFRLRRFATVFDRRTT